MVSLEFFTEYFWPHCEPGVDSAPNRYEHQEYFLWVKCGNCTGLTTFHIYVLIALKSGGLIVIETSGLYRDYFTIAIKNDRLLLNSSVNATCISLMTIMQ